MDLKCPQWGFRFVQIWGFLNLWPLDNADNDDEKPLQGMGTLIVGQTHLDARRLT